MNYQIFLFDQEDCAIIFCDVTIEIEAANSPILQSVFLILSYRVLKLR